MQGRPDAASSSSRIGHWQCQTVTARKEFLLDVADCVRTVSLECISLCSLPTELPYALDQLCLQRLQHIHGMAYRGVRRAVSSGCRIISSSC
jgi:hypothetical protein